MSSHGYRSSPNMSIKSHNVTLNSFYNINSASTVLKPFQSSLPYRVIEALSSSSRSLQNLSARISDSGWAWLVSGRWLFVWRYAEGTQEGGGNSSFAGSKFTSKTSSATSKCYELLLPPSDIAHRAELICVMSWGAGGVVGGRGAKFPSALAVSPEGALRYWANISQESNVYDSIVTASTADLHGQECLTLVDIAPVGAILGTTTGSLVHIAFNSGVGGLGASTDSSGSLGGAPFTCKTLKAPQGLLSGIGRRVSSFIFGSLPTAHQTDASKQLVRIVRSSLPSSDEGDVVLLPLYVLVLTNSTIQKWIVEDNETESLIAEIDLERHIKEAFISKLWNRSTTSHSQLTLQPMDIATVKPSSLSSEEVVLLLVVCTNSDSPGDRHIGLFTLSETALPNLSASGDASFSGQLPSSSASSASSTSIFKSFRVLSNLDLEDQSSQLNSSSIQGGANSSAAAAANSSLLPQRRHILNILPCTSGVVGSDVDDSCYIYNSSRIYRINHLDDDTADANAYNLEEIDFQLCNDYLLGALAPSNQCPLLFTFKNGFLALQSSQPESVTTKQLSTVDREFVISNDADKFSVLKRALNLFTKGEKTRALLIVQELFPWTFGDDKARPPPPNNSELDDVVCALSAHILDQIPTTDPRWASTTSSSTSGGLKDLKINTNTASINYVIITSQLEEKQETHRELIRMLQASGGAWEALTSLTTSTSSLLPTKLLLCEHAEKLVVALSLRKAQLKYGSILDEAIHRVLAKRQQNQQSQRASHLTAQDLFFREVTRIDDLFWALVELEREEMMLGGQEHLPRSGSGGNSNQHNQTAYVLSVTELFTAAFADVCIYRQANGAVYASAALASADYVPWSSAEHVAGVRETLLAQFELLLKVAAVDRFAHSAYHLASEAELEGKYGLVASKIVELADIVLDSYASQMAAMQGAGEEEDVLANNEKVSALKVDFAKTRYSCLLPLLQLKQYERAASLAEKYEDFDVLIKICEELGNEEQLQAYVAKFAAKGFSEHLFEWYLKEGKQGKMLGSSVGKHNYKLAHFLANHESLNWLHQIHLGEFKDASATLKRLATVEEKFPARKKTLLSLEKLCLIASAAEGGEFGSSSSSKEE